MQPELSLLYREEEREMLPLCQDQGVGVIPWSPLARGRLARPWGEHTPRIATDVFGSSACSRTPRHNDRTGGMPRWCGVSDGAWRRAWPRWRWPGCCSKPGVTAPIVGASQPQHLAGRAGGAGPGADGRRDGKTLQAPYLPHAVVGFD
jgi:aryl-alcohol dehydrogenase-like predicted oxidoreductase